MGRKSRTGRDYMPTIHTTEGSTKAAVVYDKRRSSLYLKMNRIKRVLVKLSNEPDPFQKHVTFNPAEGTGGFKQIRNGWMR